MIRTVIVDDEINIISNLNILLQRYCPDVIVCGMATSITQAKEIIEFEQPDLVLLDIEMPNGNGFELLKILSYTKFQLIFITAYSQYAIEAIKFSAVDYLLKPVDIDELILAIHKVANKIKHSIVNKELSVLIENLSSKQTHHKKVAVPTLEGIEFVHLNDILYCESDGHYTKIELLDGDSIFSSKRIGEYEELLPSQLFCRVHNSHLINVDHIKKYIKGKGGSVVMINGKLIDVSVRKKESFLELFSTKQV